MIRLLTEYKVDGDWLLFYKELTGIMLLAPWLLFRLAQGRYRLVSRRLILYVAFAAIICQLVGARLHVLGFAVLGLVVAVPIIQSTTLLGTAILGRYCLGDPISRNRQFAIAILIAAVVLLSVGRELSGFDATVREAESGNAFVDSDFSGGTLPDGMSPSIAPVATFDDEQVIQDAKTYSGFFLLVALGTILAGIAYSIYIIILRYVILKYWKQDAGVWISFQFTQWAGYDYSQRPAMLNQTSGSKIYSPFPVTLMMGIVLGVGLIVFGLFLWGKRGPAGFYQVPDPAVWYFVALSGICNMVGFFFQIQGLRRTTAIQASLIAISQMLVLSLVGFAFFGEPINLLVVLGLTLTVCGVFMSAKPENHDKKEGILE